MLYPIELVSIASSVSDIRSNWVIMFHIELTENNILIKTLFIETSKTALRN